MMTLKSTLACASGSSVAASTPGPLRIDVCRIWTRLILTVMVNRVGERSSAGRPTLRGAIIPGPSLR